MNVICPISEVHWRVAPYMLGMDFSKMHPIFDVPRTVLLHDRTKFIQKFRRAEMLEEKKLYFLALIHSTQLIDFQVPGKPSMKTIDKNFYPALTFTSWMDHAVWVAKDELIFPRFVVRADTQTLDNIDVWIEALDDIRKSFLEKDKMVERRRNLMQEHERLLAEITRAAQRDLLFTHQLAKWVLEFTDLDKHPRAELFLQVLKTKASETYGIDRDLLELLKELLYRHFDCNHPLFAPVMGQMNALIRAHQIHSPNFEIVYGDEPYLDADGIEQVKQVGVSDRAKQRLLDQTGSLAEPLAKDFIRRIDFHQAHARWVLAQDSIKKDKGEGDSSV